MRATVTKQFKGKGDHDASDRYFVEGETIYGDLADAAVKAGNAEEDGGESAQRPERAPRKSAAKKK
jgi:hypothetical protein